MLGLDFRRANSRIPLGWGDYIGRRTKKNSSRCCRGKLSSRVSSRVVGTLVKRSEEPAKDVRDGWVKTDERWYCRADLRGKAREEPCLSSLDPADSGDLLVIEKMKRWYGRGMVEYTTVARIWVFVFVGGSDGVTEGTRKEARCNLP